MQELNLGMTIQDIISRFNRNRVGSKPAVFLSFLPAITQVPWRDRTLDEFIRYFVYESLISSDPEAPVEISVRRRTALKDLTAFLGIQPSYWVQIRLNGRGLTIRPQTIEDLFAEVGYRCDEWVGSESTTERLGIFASFDAPRQTMVFSTSTIRGRQRFDLLLPITEPTHMPVQLNQSPSLC